MKHLDLNVGIKKKYLGTKLYDYYIKYSSNIS
jgi:hypothetical protein